MLFLFVVTNVRWDMMKMGRRVQKITEIRKKH